MKKRIMLSLMLIISLAVPQVLLANASTHYVNGIEGIKGGSLPPPGFYYKMYNAYVTADKSMDKNGDEEHIGLDVNVFAVANRFIWVTPYKLLGGDFFMDATIPLIYSNIKVDIAGIDDDEIGLGDICIEPFGIAWHGNRFDAAISQAFYLPTGDYDDDPTEPASPGLGYWTSMTTLGGTLYLDEAKTWSLSVLARYEIHSDQEDNDYTPGDDFHFEWGIGKAFAKTWEAGLAGYCQWQVSDDKGDDRPSDDHDRVFAAGPEVSVFIPGIKSFLSLRSLFEFDAEDRSEGNITVLTLTKIF